MTISTFLTAKMAALAPKVITRREMIRDVAARWATQYKDDDPHYGVRNRDVRERLEALDPETATAEAVAAIIGNPSWTKLECEVCEMDRDAVVSVPREYERPIGICQTCAEGVAQLLASAGEAGTAETAQTGSVHEHAVPEGGAQ